MSERQLYLGNSGSYGGAEPTVARRLLGWIEDLVGCNQGELAPRAGLHSRSLRYFAAGKAWRRTLERLAGAVSLPLWVVHETMFPTIATVDLVRRNFRADGTGEVGVLVEARNEGMALAARLSVLEFLVKRGRDGIDGIFRSGRGRTWAGLHPADSRVLIRWFQSLGGWTRKDFAAKAGVSHEAIRMYDAGIWPLETSVLCLLAEGAEVPFWLVEGVMLPAIRTVRLVGEHHRRKVLLAGWEGALAETRERPTSVPADILLPPMWQGNDSSRKPSVADMFVVEDLWGRLNGRSPAERALLVKNCREFHSWALVVRLCGESLDAASDSAKAALRLALLALRVARLVRGEEVFCSPLEGFAFVHIANARRVGGALRRAQEALTHGLELWGVGPGANRDLLPEWRVLDLEGSLLRTQGRFDEALDRLARAQAAAPREAWGQILVNKATVLYQMMAPDSSIAVLKEAAPLIDERKEQRLSFLRICMMGVNYCHLECYREAKELLPRAQALAAELRRFLDNLRLNWLRGRIEAGLGNRDEALSVLTWVQGELEKRKIAYDYALVSLELGEILLAQGRFAEVNDLALKLEWIFKSEEIHSEAAKALDLFRRAAKGQKATLELARGVVRYLYRARYNPELKFAA